MSVNKQPVNFSKRDHSTKSLPEGNHAVTIIGEVSYHDQMLTGSDGHLFYI
jgi:hypothetical protein